MRKALFLSLAIAAAGCAILGSFANRPRFNTLLITAEVVQNIQEIQQQYEVETVKCLTGYTALDTIYVMSIEPTWISSQSSNQATFQNCTQNDLVGYYHNHPGEFDENGEWDAFCGFSIQDYETFIALEDLHVAVISCNTNTLLWMFRGNYQPVLWTGVPETPR